MINVPRNIKDIITIYNYKEPLKPIEKGYGYYGTLIGTIDGEKVMCNICGLLFSRLNLHIIQKHDISTKDYKEKYQLAKTTALLSEAERKRSKEFWLDYWKNLSPEKKLEYKNHLINGAKSRGKFQPKLSLEDKNKRGTCPDQLLDKICKIKKELGYTPSKREFITATKGQRYYHLIRTTFGSWTNALKILQLSPKENKHNGGKRFYSDEELLEYIRIFAQENRRKPTETDFNRGYLPTTNTYLRHFGSIMKARDLANIKEFLD